MTKMDVQSIAVWLGIVGAVAGGIYAAEDRFAKRDWTEQQLASFDNRFDQQRLNEIDGQIIALDNERKRRRLSPFEEDVLRRLFFERKLLLCKLRLEKC